MVCQCVTACCSILQCVAVCYSVLQSSWLWNDVFLLNTCLSSRSSSITAHPFSLTHTSTHKHTHTHAHTLRSPLSPLSRSHICIDTRNKRLAVMQCFDCRNHLGLLGEPGFQPLNIEQCFLSFLLRLIFRAYILL